MAVNADFETNMPEGLGLRYISDTSFGFDNSRTRGVISYDLASSKTCWIQYYVCMINSV